MRAKRTEDAESVVDGYDDDVAIRCQHTAVVRVSSSEFKVVAMHEHHNRK